MNTNPSRNVPHYRIFFIDSKDPAAAGPWIFLGSDKEAGKHILAYQVIPPKNRNKRSIIRMDLINAFFCGYQLSFAEACLLKQIF